jgi:hypothetical protein
MRSLFHLCYGASGPMLYTFLVVPSLIEDNYKMCCSITNLAETQPSCAAYNAPKTIVDFLE